MKSYWLDCLRMPWLRNVSQLHLSMQNAFLLEASINFQEIGAASAIFIFFVKWVNSTLVLPNGNFSLAAKRKGWQQSQAVWAAEVRSERTENFYSGSIFRKSSFTLRIRSSHRWLVVLFLLLFVCLQIKLFPSIATCWYKSTDKKLP